MTPQGLEAAIVKVRLIAHGVPASACVTVIVAALVATTRAWTLASVGRLAGLQPRSPPAGSEANPGAAPDPRIVRVWVQDAV